MKVMEQLERRAPSKKLMYIAILWRLVGLMTVALCFPGTFTMMLTKIIPRWHAIALYSPVVMEGIYWVVLGITGIRTEDQLITSQRVICRNSSNRSSNSYSSSIDLELPIET